MVSRASPGVFIYQQRVQADDTDYGGVVYHTNYLKFMERARNEAVLAKGIDLQILAQQQDLLFVVRSLSIDYLLPAKFNSLLEVSVQQLGRKRPRLFPIYISRLCPLGTRETRAYPKGTGRDQRGDHALPFGNPSAFDSGASSRDFFL